MKCFEVLPPTLNDVNFRCCLKYDVSYETVSVIQPNRVSVFYKPVFKFLKDRYVDPYMHKHTRTYTHIHTVHTLWHSLSAEQQVLHRLVWFFSCLFSPLSYLCSFHSFMHIYCSKTVFTHMEILPGSSQKTKVEPSTLQKLLFCKRYATHFLIMYFFIHSM